MKVIGVEHKVNGDHQYEGCLKKIADALKHSPDIVVGPDYGLASFNPAWRVDINKGEKVMRELMHLSSQYPSALILPGTRPIISNNILSHAMPVFFGGEKIIEFEKQTDVENSYVARVNNCTYKRGDFTKNNLMHKGKKIALEICSDHGKQPIDKDTFLEIIVAYDLNAGFYLRADNDGFSRYALVVDGKAPMVSGHYYDHNKKEQILLEERQVGESLLEFNLKC